jgi:hypothetical protein
MFVLGPDNPRTVRRPAKGVDQIRDDFAAGRRLMIEAFVQMSDRARRAGAVDDDEALRLHGRFFDGNVAAKRAFGLAVLLAEIRR